jgi:hypothetical protein
MGCHTTYKKLITNNQEEIVSKISLIISLSENYKWYKFTSIKDFFEND